MPWCASRRQEWHSTYPTNAHERRGKEVGLPPDKVEAILCGLPTAFSAREEVVYEIAMALTNSRWWRRAFTTVQSRRLAMSASPTS